MRKPVDYKYKVSNLREETDQIRMIYLPPFRATKKDSSVSSNSKRRPLPTLIISTKNQYPMAIDLSGVQAIREFKKKIDILYKRFARIK